MARQPQLLDRWGRPIKRSTLQREIAAATIGGVRSPISGYPADGLNPMRLASILREADQGEPVRYLELAETVEERDAHYVGVLGTRRRSVSQIDISVEAASDDALDVMLADMVRDWLKRDELAEELFHILDCIGKGYSFTEIIWDTSEGQWRPERLEWRDPRWFRFDRQSLSVPMLLGDGGICEPLPAFKFVFANIPAKSGLTLRSGIARIAAWGWMFKAFTQRDWAIFTQTYGQPLRVGKYHSGASEEEKATLFRAVANIAGDCAAIIPDSMIIDFVESKTVGASADLYKTRADWLDQQISKAVLGQTATTDAIAGGHAVGQEHRQVQADIERADAKALAAILNRDLIRPWIDLEFGPQRRYPRLVIARPEPEDLKALTEALGILVPLGLRVEASEVRDKLKLSEPAAGAEILGVAAPAAPQSPSGITPPQQTASLNGVGAFFKRGPGLSAAVAPQNEQGPSAAISEAVDPVAVLDERLAGEAQPEIRRMLEQIEAMLTAAESFDEFREMLRTGFPDIDSAGLGEQLGLAMVAAHVAGRAAVEQDDAF